MADDKSRSRYACDYCWKKKDQQPGFGDETHSSVTSTFSDTHNVLNFNQMRNSLADITSQGSGMLSDLYDQFKDSTYDYDKIKAAVKMARRDHEPFFIPTEPIGAMFIQLVDRGYPLLSRPPQEMLFDLVFRPSSVDKRGWVLMLNTILATASTQNQQLSEYTFQLRWNAWLAADEASLFMEPTILNIQAWTVFAVHGQDLVTPSLCWNLINQVCRMAQMIKLPLPSASAKRDSELHSRSLCLFWSLFITEKSLSLSFGCPPVLPSALYRNLELPSPKQLSAYRPHLSGAGTDRPPHVEFFGAFYFVQCTKLAMIMGDMSDFYLLSSHDPGRHLELKRRLDQWISVVEQVSKSDENE
ncbi:fungal specific transcription factor domain-containing protein [Fonsecaea pedrosoi]|nr:fungal specific transcription factor domain-containing protein [Fonsecaea pedrosoi]